MSDKKIYEVGGKSYFCDELTLAQDEILVGLLAQMEFNKLIELFGYVSVLFGGEGSGAEFVSGEKIDLESVLAALGQKGLLSLFVATVLTPEGGEFDEAKIPEIQKAVRRLKRSQYLEVIADFLHRNERSLKRVFGFSERANGKRQTAKSKKSQRRRASSLS